LKKNLKDANSVFYCQLGRVSCGFSGCKTINGIRLGAKNWADLLDFFFGLGAFFRYLTPLWNYQILSKNCMVFLMVMPFFEGV